MIAFFIAFPMLLACIWLAVRFDNVLNVQSELDHMIWHTSQEGSGVRPLKWPLRKSTSKAASHLFFIKRILLWHDLLLICLALRGSDKGWVIYYQRRGEMGQSRQGGHLLSERGDGSKQGRGTNNKFWCKRGVCTISWEVVRLTASSRGYTFLPIYITLWYAQNRSNNCNRSS